MRKRSEKTVCDVCRAKTPERRFRRLHEREQRSLLSEGWNAHFVVDDHDCPFGVNYHTHSLPESFAHLDLQIVIPLRPATAHRIARKIVALIKQGRRFKPGDMIFNVVPDFPITCVKAVESGRTVLRLVFPDENGVFARSKMSAPFARQYLGTSI